MSKRSRRTDNEIFWDALKEISKDGNTSVGNITLRRKINWDEEKYNRVKSQLVSQNKITLGTGRGGTVSLGDSSTEGALKVFISYSHADESITKDLIKHIEPLKKHKLIKSWHDRQLNAGDTWEEEIAQHLKDADIILLIVSIDFINSNYCYNIELEQALKQHEAGDTKVIPIIARNCMWYSELFGKQQALPKDGKPISQWNNKDEVLTTIAQGIEEVAKELQKA